MHGRPTTRRGLHPAFLALGLLAAAVAGPAAPAGAAATPVLKVTSTEDLLGLSSRLVFSSVKAAVTPARTFTVANNGTAALKVTALTIAGTNPSQFKLRAGQATAFTVNPGRTTTVGVVFKPASVGVKQATLTVKNNDPARPNHAVALRGVNAAGPTGRNEASLASIVSAFGYTTKVGFANVQQAKTRLPVGDEVVAPYFRRADATKPVRLVPLARYVFAVNPSPHNGYQAAKGSSATTNLFTFPGDTLDPAPGDGTDSTVYVENEKTFPAISPGGTTTFEPAGPFGVSGEGMTYTDDQFNRAADGLTTYRSVRAYPAKGASGAQILNTWILAVDTKNTPDKNFDYQDIVLLLSNATPDLAKGPASVSLGFNGPTAATVADRDGEGTGFTSVQPNATGNQLQPTALDLTTGSLRVASGAGTNEGPVDTQANALTATVDASRSDTVARTRLVDPLADLLLTGQRKGIWFGPGPDDTVSVVVERRVDGPYVTVRAEQDGVNQVIGEQALTAPVATLDLILTADLVAGTVQASFQVGDVGPPVVVGTAFVPLDVMAWFSPQGRSGVVTSHGAAASGVVAVYDSFTAA
jgi:hypothetical protein